MVNIESFIIKFLQFIQCVTEKDTPNALSNPHANTILILMYLVQQIVIKLRII